LLHAVQVVFQRVNDHTKKKNEQTTVFTWIMVKGSALLIRGEKEFSVQELMKHNLYEYPSYICDQL